MQEVSENVDERDTNVRYPMPELAELSDLSIANLSALVICQLVSPEMVSLL